jgi:DNA-binding transcriptional LysR family regulator
VATAVATACQSEVGGVVELTTASTTELVDAVTAGQLDLAVVIHPALLGALRSGPVARFDTTLLVPAAHPAARSGESVAVRSLRGLRIAIPPRSHGTAAHDLLLDTLDQRGLVAPALTAVDERAALVLVATGRAFALTADPDLGAPGVERRPVAGDPLPLRLRVVWRKDAPDTAVPDAVLSVLRDNAGVGAVDP